MALFHEKLKVALGGVVPLGLRDSFADLVRGKTTSIYIIYEDVEWTTKLGEFIQSSEVGFQDGVHGIVIFENT